MSLFSFSFSGVGARPKESEEELALLDGVSAWSLFAMPWRAATSSDSRYLWNRRRCPAAVTSAMVSVMTVGLRRIMMLAFMVAAFEMTLMAMAQLDAGKPRERKCLTGHHGPYFLGTKRARPYEARKVQEVVNWEDIL